MPFTICVDDAGPWLSINFSHVVDGRDLITSREVAARSNDAGYIRDFILDFSDVSAFVLSPDAVERIMHVDKARSSALPSGRCAIVAHRDLIEIGTTYLAVVSHLDLDFRTFKSRQQAEAWLRGELSGAPPTLPRRK